MAGHKLCASPNENGSRLHCLRQKLSRGLLRVLTLSKTLPLNWTQLQDAILFGRDPTPVSST